MCLSLLAVLSGCGGESDPIDAGRDGGMIDGGGGDCASAPDGTSCGAGTICVDGSCIEASCGDGFTSDGEECDDANAIAFDGCEPDSCVFTCALSESCTDEEPCNGAETCSGTHVCVAGTALSQGTDCTTRDVSNGVCRGTGTTAACAPPGCGNGVTDGTEDCDDMNEIGGDGCEGDCSFTCASDDDCRALDRNVCDGPDACNLGDHRCVPTVALDCDDSVACTDDTCDASTGCAHTDNGTGQFWYPDCDGDDFAAGELGSVQSCAMPAIGPAVCSTGGWTSRRPIAGDIDCVDRNAEVHPGATAYHNTEIDGTIPDATDFDYNCDGVEEPYGSDALPCNPGDYHFDTRAGSGWACGAATAGGYKWVCSTSSVPGHWERFRSGEDQRVPCR